MADVTGRLAGGAPGEEGEGRTLRDVGFAFGVVAILAVLFVPLPTFLIDVGLAFSIALSVLILMVSLWIQRPLEFSAFPTVLLIATLLRLALSIATTRLILADGHEGIDAAGTVIAGFSQFVMSGDFVIGIVVFLMLVVVNFLVITKGATRIAEVAARFTLDAMPGKQMAIDADLANGVIDDKEATRRRRELEEESSFYGSMDGASKFVRGEAIAGLIIIAVNIVGGIVIGTTRQGLSAAEAVDIYSRLSVGDGLVSQIPALIVSLAAGLLVSKGGTRGSAEKAVLSQLGAYPRALLVAAALMGLFALLPGLPTVPFAALAALLAFVAWLVPRQARAERAAAAERQRVADESAAKERQDPVREQLRAPDLELVIGKQLARVLLSRPDELAHRVAKLRRKFAGTYGFVVPEIKVSESLSIDPKGYQIRIHGTAVARETVRLGESLVVVGDGPMPDVPGDEVREPAFGMRSLWVADAFASDLRRDGFTPIDPTSVVLTHLSEVIRSNLAQLLSYRDMRALFERLEPEYRRLLDDICPAQISWSGLLAVLKLLLAERVSIRSLHLVLEAVAEIVPHARRAELVAEHVRGRIAQQICGDLAEDGVLKVLRLGNRWDLAFHQGLRRDARGDVAEFDLDPQVVEQFGEDAARAIRAKLATEGSVAVVTAPDARPYVRMILERMFPALPVLSHLEIARGVEIRSLGAIA